MTKPRKPRKPRAAAKAAPREAYGYVLILRALARAAIKLGTRRACALRVLNVLSQHLSQEGVCVVGQDTIAGFLGITRQAVNRHMKVLVGLGILNAIPPRRGAALEYRLVTNGLAERYGAKNVAARKARKRGEPPAPLPPPVPPPAPPADSTTAAWLQDDNWNPENIAAGDWVKHAKLGIGQVVEVDRPILRVQFRSGSQHLLPTFCALQERAEGVKPLGVAPPEA